MPISDHRGRETSPPHSSLSTYLSLLRAGITSKQKALLQSKKHLITRSPHFTVFSCTSLISAYTNHGFSHEAIRIYEVIMQEQNIQPNIYTIVSLLKACGHLADIARGMMFHAIAIECGEDLCNSFVGNTLVSMYGKCGSIREAEHSFNSCRGSLNIVTWNAMISANIDLGRSENALILYIQMQQDGFTPDRPTFMAMLHACSIFTTNEQPIPTPCGQCVKVKSLEIAHSLHVDIIKNGFASNLFVNSSLMKAYGRCGALQEAKSVFSALPHHDVVCCSAMLSAYVEHGYGVDAIQLYRQLCEKEGVKLDPLAIVLALQACGFILSHEEKSETVNMCLKIGRALHSQARRQGFGSEVSLSTALISFYCQSGAIDNAEHVFSALSVQEHTCWNALLSAYIDRGEAERALCLYIHMHDKGVNPNIQTYVITFQACSRLAESEEAIMVGERYIKFVSLEITQALHTDAQAKGFVCEEHLGNIILSAYGKCGAISEAEELFCGLALRTVVSWSAMMSGYIEWGHGEMALRLYRQMQNEAPDCNDALTCTIALQACISLSGKEGILLERCPAKSIGLEIGRALHARAFREGFVFDVLVSCTLVSMYSRCGTMIEAQNVFSELLSKPTTNVAWCVMLSTYIEHRELEKALLLYRKRQEEGHDPDQVTMTLALQACSFLAEREMSSPCLKLLDKPISLEIGEALHADARREGIASDMFVGSNLIAMYAKCGCIIHAESVFSLMPTQVIAPWTAMFTAYLEHGLEENIPRLYKQMVAYRITLDEVTLISLLQTCDGIGSLEMCRKLHFDVVCAGYYQNASLSSSLLYTYGGCASMADAQCCFDELLRPDIVSLNAGISGYTREGNALASLEMFELSKLVNLRPSEVSFLSILSACGHAGLVVSGLEYFISIWRDHGLNPDVKHYGSMLDLLARAGDFKRTQSVMTAMPVEANQPIWLSLLASCRTHCNLEVAKHIFHNAVCLDATEASQYILMSKIHADSELLQKCRLLCT